MHPDMMDNEKEEMPQAKQMNISQLMRQDHFQEPNPDYAVYEGESENDHNPPILQKNPQSLMTNIAPDEEMKV